MKKGETMGTNSAHNKRLQLRLIATVEDFKSAALWDNLGRFPENVAETIGDSVQWSAPLEKLAEEYDFTWSEITDALMNN